MAVDPNSDEPWYSEFPGSVGFGASNQTEVSSKYKQSQLSSPPGVWNAIQFYD